MVPAARPFVTHLWGAVDDAKNEETPKRARTRKRPKELIFVRRFGHAASWISECLKDEKALVRRYSLLRRLAPVEFGLRTDASPFGMGGILFRYGTGEIVGFWADELNESDLSLFGAVKGDPKWQSEWELYAVLVSVVVFEGIVKDKKMALQTDNTATMRASMVLKSPTATMNAIASEIALRLDRNMTNFEVAEHIPGLLNHVADSLSRLSEGAKLPECLVAAQRFQAPCRSRDSGFLICWPQDW